MWLLVEQFSFSTQFTHLKAMPKSQGKPVRADTVRLKPNGLGRKLLPKERGFLRSGRAVTERLNSRRQLLFPKR